MADKRAERIAELIKPLRVKPGSKVNLSKDFDPAYQAYAMFDSMFRDLGGLPINQAQEGVQPTQILTKSNINSVNIKNGFWSEPADAPSQFQALWHMQ